MKNNFEIHADDIGLSNCISKGILESLQKGYVTGVSLMVGQSDTENSFKEIINNNLFNKIRICLHLNLNEGQASASNNTFINNNIY